MKTTGNKANLPNLVLPILLAGLAMNVNAAVTDLATAPMVNGSSILVRPNIFLMMDDSGSMQWDYMPDNNNNPFFSTSKYGYPSAQCNGVYYDPIITYSTPPLSTPVTLTSGVTTSGSPTISFASSTSPKVGQVIIGSSIPSGAYIVSLSGTTQATLNVNATATTSGASFTINNYPLSSFNAAPIDGYGATTTSTLNLGLNFGLGQYTDTSPTTTGGGPAYYYNYIGTQITETQKNFYSSSSTFFSECNSSIGSTPGSGVFTKVYVGTTSTLAISAPSSAVISGIKVNSQQIMSAASSSSSTANTVATNIAAQINACTTAVAGSCTVAGYHAAVDGSTVTIIAPIAIEQTIDGLTPVVTLGSGSMTGTPTTFVDSGPGNTDETTNFANWYSYYRTRILMMKSASGMAFNKLDQNYRVGFGTMNNNGGSKFLNLATYDSTQKNNFLAMLYSTSANNSTPLLQALSKVGLMYADKIATINGVTVSDPMEYSCQQNYTILSTDGFWNDATNQTLTAGPSTTAVGNQDGTEPTNSKQYDGSVQHYYQQTGVLQFTTTQEQTVATLQWASTLKETGYKLAMWTDQQATSGTLQKQTAQLQSSTSSPQSGTSTLTGTVSQVLMSCAHKTSTCKSAPTNGIATTNWVLATSCTTATSNQCAVVSPSPALVVNVASKCNTGATISGSSPYSITNGDGSYVYSSCSYSTPATWTSVASCTDTRSATPNNTTVVSATQCQYAAYSGAVNASSCTTVAQSAVGPGKTIGTATQCSSLTSAWNNVGSGGSCMTGAASGLTTSCRLSGSATAYVSNYPVPSCTVTYNNPGTSVADSSGNAVSACPVVAGGPQAKTSAATVMGPNQTCDWTAPDAANPHLWCDWYPSFTTTTSNVTAYPPVCPGFNQSVSGGLLFYTTDANGLMSAGCSTGSATTPQTVASNGSCNSTLPNVQCSTTGATTNYVTTDPPTCAVTYNSAGNSTAVGTSVVTACPLAASFNPTWTNSTSGSCTPSATVNCQYAWGTSTSAPSCTPNACTFALGSTCTTSSASQCSVTTTGGTSNTLSDVAEYYYRTDLRTSALGNCTSGATGNTLCSSTSPDPYDNVPPALGDTASWQHMTTFTMGLGARGRMVYSPTYKSDSSGDYFAINNQTANGTICSWQASGTCTWPIPNVSGAPENIDDLWHAAVDGRGVYYSATNPTALSAGLTNALATVQERTGTAAAATTSDPNISQGNNFLFASTFVTMEWTGEFVREQMNLSTGQVVTTIDPLTGKSVPVNDWTAQSQLDAQAWATRNIYTFDSTNANGNKLKLLTWANLTTTEQALFTDPGIDTLSQLCTTPPAAWQANHAYVAGNQFIASGSPYLVLINYTSTGTFGVNDVAPYIQTLSTPVCLPVWSASTFYAVGAQYRVISGSNTTWYQVNTAYTSGASFGATDTANATALTGGANASGAAGANLVNFLRGDRSNEEGSTPDNTKYYRYRTHVLGDIVNSEGAYVSPGSAFSYADPGYSNFTSNVSTRQGMVYVAANDGMLHAFYADSNNMDTTTGNVVTSGGVAVSGGAEAWTYVPKMVQANLYKLADKNYKNQHEYTVDGTPFTGDVCVSSCTSASTAVWKTILVGGLNGGGRGYYALDITNPAHPVGLWEFTDTNMGYTYGNPVITKLNDGTWVVLLTSGYNNVTPGDGQGHLYVLDAYTGTLHTAVNGTGIISTGVGSTTTPSGLARIAAEVVDPSTNNMALQVYGGDLNGDLWRFDINNNVGAAGYDAQLLVQLLGPTGTPQPITVKPEVGYVGTSTVVYVGTGRYLGQSDINAADQLSPNTQTLYGIYDPLLTTSTSSVAIYSNPRANTCPNPQTSPVTTGCFLQQTLSTSSCPAGASTSLCSLGQLILTSTNNPGSIPSPNVGWYVDLPFSSQRDNTDPALQRGTLDFTVNLPTGAGAQCTNGGSSYNLALDYQTGGAVNTAAVTVTNAFGVTSTVYIAGVFLGNALATRPIFVELPSGAVVALIRMGTGDTNVTNVPIGTGGSSTRRVSWRELMQ